MQARTSKSSRPAVPPGHRIYAIGDVHGEGSLLRQLLEAIKADHAARGDAEVTVVFVGDLIDRGPDAADILKSVARVSADHVVVIRGNHESALIEAYRGNRETLIEWLPFGAAATLAGFGITTQDIDSPIAAFEASLHERIDPDLVEWLEGLPGKWECGDYYFTHAGIRPGVALDEQDERDLLWIREPFLSSRKRHGKVIVHGHTVEPGLPPLGRNRIGIDTGAHEHGVLTAVGLEGEDQWLLQAKADRRRQAMSSAVASANGKSTPNTKPQQIETLIAAIVAPAFQSKPAGVRRTLSEAALILRNPIGRARGLGKGGYVTAGFALIVALVGGTIAISSRHSAPPTPSSITIPLSDPPATSVMPEPTGIVVQPAPKNGDKRQRTPRPSNGSAVVRDVAPSADETPSSKLYGPELERALEEDRATTRRLNEDELSRNRPQSSTPK